MSPRLPLYFTVMTYELKLINKSPWAGVIKYAGCTTAIGAYMTRSGSLYTGLTPEDERYFEKELGYPEGQLAKNSSFWTTFAVKLNSRPQILDDSFPRQAMIIKFLAKHKRVAHSMKEAASRKYDAVMINKEQEAIVQNKKNMIRRKAFKEFDKLDLTQMRNALRLLGSSSVNMSNELVESSLFALIDKNPQRFLDVYVDNAHRETQILIEEAISAGVIRKDKTQYFYGTELMATSLSECIKYLDDKKNQDLRIAIASQIENK